MRYLISLLFLLLFGSTIAGAQNVRYSEFAPFDLRTGNMAVVGKVNNMLYTFRSYGKEYFLDAYDDKMERKATIVLDFFPEKIYDVKFVAYDDKMLVMYQQQIGTRITQYAAMLNERGMLLKSVKVDETRSGFFGSADNSFFNTAASEDKNHIVVYRALIKNKKLEFSAAVLDIAQMKVSKRVNLVYKGEETLNNAPAQLSNDGTLYLPVFTDIGSRNYSDEYVILTLRESEQKFRISRMNIGDNFLEYPFQKIDNVNGKIYFASFFSSRKNGNNEGVAANSFDMNTLTFSETRFIPFTDAMRGEANARRRERALNEFKINRLIIKNDGGFLVAAEEMYVTTQNAFTPGIGFYSFYYTPALSQTIREYHYNDILLLSYDAAGTQEWYSFLRKEQYSQEDGGLFSSYTLLNTGGGLGFLFNDFNNRRSRIQLTSVAPDGKISVGYMDAGRDDDPDWLPRQGKQVDAREVVIPCLRKKQICFAKIVL